MAELIRHVRLKMPEVRDTGTVQDDVLVRRLQDGQTIELCPLDDPDNEISVTVTFNDPTKRHVLAKRFAGRMATISVIVED